MSSKIETSMRIDSYNYIDNFINIKNNSLDFEKVLIKFQQFMKEQYNKKEKEFLERNGRLIFLAFIKPIINGQGYDFKEVQISEEKRLDVVITFGSYKYISELKIWRGKEAHKKGIKQLADYLEHQGLTHGYLVIYDTRKKVNGKGNGSNQEIKKYSQYGYEKIISQKRLFSVRQRDLHRERLDHLFLYHLKFDQH